jgi:glycerol-3-phosphate dehydrogenase (NAD(P)+)
MAEILGEMRQVAEGVKTAKVAKELAAKLDIDAPIVDAMYAIIHEGMPVRDVISKLLQRPARSERD